MKKNLILIAMLMSANSYAVDVIIKGNQTFIQDKGQLSSPQLTVVNDNVIRFSDIIDTNIPETFSFRVGHNYANRITYDTRNLSNDLSNPYALYSFLKNKIGSDISFIHNDETKNGSIYKVIGETVFVKNNNNIIPVSLDSLIFNENLFESKDFNLITKFNNKINKNEMFEYSYFANGFSWNPNYTLFLDDEKETLDLNFYANIRNNSNTDLKDINLILLSEERNENKLRMNRKESFKSAEQFSMFADSASPSPITIENENVGNINAYKIKEKQSLLSSINSSVLIKDFKELKYTKNNYVHFNKINEYNIWNDNKEGIVNTSIRIKQKENKKLNDYYFPQSSLEILYKKDGINYPYKNVTFSPLKNKNIEIPLIKNEELIYFSKIKDRKDVEFIKKEQKGYNETTYRILKEQYKKNNYRNKSVVNFVDNGDYYTITTKEPKYVYKYKIKTTQYFENKSNYDELFVILLKDNLTNKDIKASPDYMVEHDKEDNTIRYSLNVSKKDNKEASFTYYIHTNNKIKF